MGLSNAQQEIRRLGYGGSDVGAIMGKNPWKRPYDVWEDKTGRAPARESTERSRNGHRFEAPARAWYVEDHRPGAVIRQPGTIVHPTLPWWLGTPDGIVWNTELAMLRGDEPDRGMEIKTHTIHLRHLYGDAGTDQVPPWELLQCAWYMGCTGLPEWDLVALIDGEFTPYTIRRDLELEQILADAVQHFDERYVKAGVPPPPDGSESYAAALLRKHPKHLGEQIVEADEAIAAAAAELRELRIEEASLKRRKELIEQHIKEAIGDAAGISFPNPEGKGTAKITWKRCADSMGVDWQALAMQALTSTNLTITAAAQRIEELASAGTITQDIGGELFSILGVAVQELVLEDLKAKYTKITKAGSRRFNVPRSWTGGEE
jgi:putative phage-type endonuclease